MTEARQDPPSERELLLRLAPFLLGGALLVFEVFLGDFFADVMAEPAGSERRVPLWLGLSLVTLVPAGFALAFEKVRRVAAAGAEPITRLALPGIRSFSFLAGPFFMTVAAVIMLVEWASSSGLGAPVSVPLGLGAAAAFVVSALAYAGRVQRVAVDGERYAAGRFLGRLPGWLVDGGLATWSLLGVALLWHGLGRAVIVYAEPSIGDAVLGGIGALFFFALFFLPWRHPRTLVAAMRREPGATGPRELWDLFVVFLFVYVPIPYQAAQEAPLHRAARAGDIGELERLADAGWDLEHTFATRQTPLHLAARAGQADAARWLLDRGVDPEPRDGRGITPLYDAIERGKPQVAGALLAAGADINAPNRGNRTVLHFAVESRPLELVAALLEAGADPQRRDIGGRTALHVALGRPADRDEARDLALLLIAHGADVDDPDRSGMTPRSRLERRGVEGLPPPRGSGPPGR